MFCRWISSNPPKIADHTTLSRAPKSWRVPVKTLLSGDSNLDRNPASHVILVNFPSSSPISTRSEVGIDDLCWSVSQWQRIRQECVTFTEARVISEGLKHPSTPMTGYACFSKSGDCHSPQLTQSKIPFTALSKMKSLRIPEGGPSSLQSPSLSSTA